MANSSTSIGCAFWLVFLTAMLYVTGGLSFTIVVLGCLAVLGVVIGVLWLVVTAYAALCDAPPATCGNNHYTGSNGQQPGTAPTRKGSLRGFAASGIILGVGVALGFASAAIYAASVVATLSAICYLIAPDDRRSRLPATIARPAPRR